MAAPIATESIKKSVWKGWGVAQNVASSPNSLQQVMSEELAMELTQQFQHATIDNSGVDQLPDEIPQDVLPDPPVELPDPSTAEKDDTSSDLLLAMMLQHEFDQEFDANLKKEQDKRNGHSKVVVSRDNYRAVHPALRNEVDLNEDLFNVPEAKMPKVPSPCFNSKGVSGKGKNAVTKHDAKINGMKNALKVMDTFPPEFETGNHFDLKIPNKVFNSLKVNSNLESKRGQRHHEKKEHSTQMAAIDERTKLLLYKLENNEAFESFNGIVSTGKEAVVFHAEGGRNLPDGKAHSELAVKVYKTTLGKFKNRCLYVKGDLRFIKDDFKRQNPRKIMRIWAEKEEMNLRRMRRFNVPCPDALFSKKHVLVMTFIGRKGQAAPKFKDVTFTKAELDSAYEQSVKIMKTLYGECHLVHADLSEFNLLWHEGTAFVIDVAQSVDSVQSKALEFLMRDCQNITKFFKLRGLEKMMTWQQLFNDITGMKAEGEGEVFLSQIVKKTDDEATVKLDRTKYDFPFDFFFKKSCKDKLAPEEFGAGVAESDDDDDDEDFGDDDDGDDEKEGGVKDDDKVAKDVVEDEKGDDDDDDDDDWESIDSDWSIISD